MIDILLYGILYLTAAATCIMLVVLFLFLCEGYRLTKEQKKQTRVKIEPVNTGLDRWELDRIVSQVMKNDRKRMKKRKRGYEW